jgi:hypothetical protein
MWVGGHRAAGAAVMSALTAVGIVVALVLAGVARGLEVPTTTVAAPSLPSTTVTTPSIPIVSTSATVTTPSAPATTAATPRVTPPPPATSVASEVSSPSSDCSCSPPPPSPSSLPKLPDVPGATRPHAPATAAGTASQSGSSNVSSANGSSGGPVRNPSGAAGTQKRTSTTPEAPDAALGSTAAYRPAYGSPAVVSLPSSRGVALDFGAFIVPVGDHAGRVRRLRTVGLSELRPGEADIFSLLGFPDVQRGGRVRSTRRPDSGITDVLGKQARIGELGEGGELTFGQLPLIALALVLLSSLLLVGAVMPPGIVARTPVSPRQYARLRQPLALASIAILLPVAFVAFTAALS